MSSHEERHLMACLETPPPEEDTVASLLWHLLQPPKAEDAITVQVTPSRCMTVLPVPYLLPELLR